MKCFLFFLATTDWPLILRQIKVGAISTALSFTPLLGAAQAPEMRPIPTGTFQMGSLTGDADEKPVHTVTVSSFHLAKTETTFTQFKIFVDATGYVTDAERGDGSFVWDSLGWHKRELVSWRHDERGRLRSRTGGDFGNFPVLHVSWLDAARYCNWLSRQFGLEEAYSFSGDTVNSMYNANGYRLPGEAEWEYAATAGRALADHPASSGRLHALAWYSGNANHRVPAGALKNANAFGLHDLQGSVWEWCHDWYARNAYTAKSKSDAGGPPGGQERALRGGSWNNNGAHCRITNRSSRYPDFRDGSVGFRVARR